MLQQWLIAGIVSAAVVATAPVADPCAAVHIADPDVAHVPSPEVEPWIDEATAALVAAPPRVERRVGDDGAIVDIAVPSELIEEPDRRCR